MKRDLWKDNISEEVDYWKGWAETQGLEYPEDYKFRLDPNSQLQDSITKYLGDFKGDVLKILDVGAGPLTILGKTWKNIPVEITAVDALAEIYATLNLPSAPVRTQYCESERLREKFPVSSFDAVHARNTLDHGYNPVQAIVEMIFMAKPNGIIIVDHYAYEAIKGDWQGLHQWNFFVENNCLMVADKTTAYNISDVIKDYVIALDMTPAGGRTASCVWRKKAA